MKFDTRTVLWSLLKYIGSGIVIMWLTFWYLSGSFWGLPRLFVAYYAASQVFMTPMSKATLYDGMLKGLIGSLGEPHSIYLDADEFKSMKMQTSGTYAGVGMVLGHDDKGLYAVSIMEDQPAFKAGIKPGDHIIAIDGQSTSDITVEDASVVALDIERNGEKLHFDITRESIVLPTVKSKMLTSTVGYIRISQFAENTADDFETQFKELQSQGMKELILDLRDNPGGLLSTTEKISNYIMPPGTLVTVQNRAGKKEVYKSNGPDVAMPLVALVNKGSASASEIIAGAIQDRKLGTILGTNTYGKGTVQTIYPSLDNEGVKVTIAKYHTPNDRVIDGIGIKPDVELDLPKGVNPSSTLDDIQIKKALELLQQ